MMILHNSLLRLRRTPLKTLLFFLLITLAAALIATGGGLWKLCRDNTEYFVGLFRTIATVEQKPEQIVKAEEWDAEVEGYTVRNAKRYGETIPRSVLDFEGADYINGPETRAWYAAYVPEYLLMDENEGRSNGMIVEASPVEDGAPAGPLRMEITRILYSYYPENASHIYFCDHYNDDPEMMYADKTYVLSLITGSKHGGFDGPGHDEYNPWIGPSSTQSMPDGTRMETALSGESVAEVTPDFYQTDEGKAWLALIEEMEMGWNSVPVTATANTALIPVFYDGDVTIEQGREISAEEYDEGRKVCLVSRKFAKRNGLQVGDDLHLPLRYANYAYSANMSSMETLTAKGEVYPVFEDDYWEICGIYDEQPTAGAKGWGYRLAYNEVIIPASSIKNSEKNNIAAMGRMMGYTTSFEIPNGSIAKWQKLWEEEGIDGLEITFYDKGYTQLEEGLRRMERMAVILLAAGGISALCILVFFCHLFITKQSTRTAVERSLGMSKRQCTVSLLSGIVLIALCGCIAGSVAGYFCTTGAMEQITEVERFDRRYSSSSVSMAQDEKQEEQGYIVAGDWRVGALTGTVMMIFAVGISMTMIRQSLRREPLMLLSGREE